MKQGGFLKGAFSLTASIFICKIIGVFYVIPFYAMIGSEGGALYSYAYSIYAVFLSLSTSGIPIAISKLISEYQALGYEQTKDRVYRLSFKLMLFLSGFLFLIMFFGAPMFANLILGGSTGGNSKASVTLVIRVVSTSLLIVPLLAVIRGFFQGQKRMDLVGKANVLEQLVRVAVLLGGSFLVLNVFHKKVDQAVAVAVFGSTVGALVTFFYLLRWKRKQKKNRSLPVVEKKFSNAYLVKKILIYALPFLVIEGVLAAFSLVDTFTVVRTLTNVGFSASQAEVIQSIMTTWGSKLNMIVVSLSLGLSMSLVPYIASSYIKHQKEEVTKRVHEAFLALALFVFPAALGLSFLSTPVWTLFYGFDHLSSEVFLWFIFTAVSFSFLSMMIHIAQTMNQTKAVMRTLGFLFLGKVLMNIPSIYLCSKLGIPAYLGPIFVTILLQVLGACSLFLTLQKQEGLPLERTLYYGLKIFLCALIMWVSLKIVELFFPLTMTTRGMSLVAILGYGIFGALLYAILIWKSGIWHEIFPQRKLQKRKKKE